MKIEITLTILAIFLVLLTMINANINASSEWNDSCYDAGYDDGQNKPFNHDTYDTVQMRTVEIRYTMTDS